MVTGEYIAMIISGIFIYAALGAIICMLSMLVKSSTASVIVCLCYVLFNETAASVISGAQNVGGSGSVSNSGIASLVVKHSLYGMSILVSGTANPPEHILFIALNSCAIILISIVFGIVVFRGYEL